VAAEIVDDDDVAGLEHWHQDLFDIGDEADPVDRPIDYARVIDMVAAQGGEEGERAPTALRELRDQPFAAGPRVCVMLGLAQVSSMKTSTH
jgi:hypothetical protein